MERIAGEARVPHVVPDHQHRARARRFVSVNQGRPSRGWIRGTPKPEAVISRDCDRLR